MAKRYITSDDILDTFIKLKQRGGQFILSKFAIDATSRTKSAFDESSNISSNWWIVPAVRERWNRLISGSSHRNYKEYLMEEVLRDRRHLKLLSLGSGNCSHEIELASYQAFEKVTCVDIAENRLNEAQKIAESKGLKNMVFHCQNIYDYDFSAEKVDVVLFNASLHHFTNVYGLLKDLIRPTLDEDGLLVINEYVGPNRLQFPKVQIQAINDAIQLIPPQFRQRYKTTITKRKYSGSGLWRMILADPSECVDSASIIPSVHALFDVIIERPYGGNILMSALKDIAHHFVETNPEKKDVLNALFEFEDKYLEQHPSDFVFGVYRATSS